MSHCTPDKFAEVPHQGMGPRPALCCGKLFKGRGHISDSQRLPQEVLRNQKPGKRGSLAGHSLPPHCLREGD